jgi:hypothetical protein
VIDDNQVLGSTMAAFYLNSLRFEVKFLPMASIFKSLGVDVAETLAIKEVAMMGQKIFSDSQNAIFIAKTILGVDASWLSRCENMPANWLAKNKKEGKGLVRINSFSPSRKCIEFHFDKQ